MNDRKRYLESIESGAHAGWTRYRPAFMAGFLQAIGCARFRAESESMAIVELETDERALNGLGSIHGGFLAAFADHSIFAAMHAFEPGSGFGAVTVDMNIQFLRPAAAGVVLRARVERLHETGRLLFVRAEIGQETGIVAHFTATVSKARGRTTQ